MRISKYLAAVLSCLAFAGTTAFVTAAAAPATAAIVNGGGKGDANTGEDFIVEEGDFFLNEEDDPNPFADEDKKHLHRAFGEGEGEGEGEE
jgi:hypothetical protein